MTTETTETGANPASIDWNDEAARTAHVQSLIENEVKGLKAKRDELLAAQQKFKGFDPDEYARLKSEHQKREDELARRRGDFEKLEATLREQAKTREQKLMGALHQRTVDAEALAAISAEGGNTKLLLPLIKNKLRMAERDDGFAVEVLDDYGAPTSHSVRDLVAAMKADPDYAAAFRSAATAGSGASTSSGHTSGVKNPYDKSSWNMTEQARLERNDPNLAKSLRESATR